MKTLTTLFLLISAMAFGQVKPRYFLYTVDFKSTDGCSHSQSGWFQSIKVTVDYDFIYANMVNYVKPYKIIKSTFHIIEYKQVSYAEFKSYKANKFEGCKSVTYHNDSTIMFKMDTSTHNLNWVFNQNIKIYDFYYRNIVYTTHKDSIVTVHLFKNYTKLNDSTFTFKLTK